MDNLDITEFDPALVNVSVATTYLPGHSRPEDDQYTFAYTITINNDSDLPVQLLSRHWVITDADNHVEEVRGEGVVGEQPHLKPGEVFRYTSGTVIETPVGTMEGEYGMLGDDGQEFLTPVDRFSLSVPRVLH